MSTADQSPSADTVAYVQLFQKAHQKIVMLERIDEQLTQLISRRDQIQEELREVQSQINDEFDTRLRAGDRSQNSSRPLSVTIGDAVKRHSGNGANGSARFAATAIDAASE